MVENNEKMYLELLDFDTDKKEKWVKQYNGSVVKTKI